MIKRFSFYLIRPYWMFAFTSFLSFIAWLLPISGGIYIKGFSPPQQFFTANLIYILVWDFGIFYIAFLGFYIGRRYSYKPKNSKEINSDLRPYYFFNFVGVIGLVSSYIHIIDESGIRLLIYQLFIHNGNFLKKELYNGYSIGIYSLRYVVIISSAIAIYRIVSKKFHIMDLFNILSLLLLLIISSRLSLIISLVIASCLAITDEKIRIGSRKIIISFVLIFSVLTVANYIRNANFYERFNINNPIFMNLVQIDAYLGTSFQGELATADHALLRDGLKLNLSEESRITNIATNFNANSSLNTLMNYYGIYGIIIGFVFSFFASFVMGSIRQNNKKIIFCLYGVLLYCFSDLYRIFMFNKGIILTMIIIIIVSEFFHYVKFGNKIRLQNYYIVDSKF